MVKKRKPAAAKSATPRRVSQRGKKAETDEANPAEPDPPPISDPSPADIDQNASPIPSKSDAIVDLAAIKASEFPIVALHKKFGKYRCLVKEEGCPQKYELGSDSETSCSMDMKTANPCATSESDSNTASEINTDATSNTQSPMDTRHIDNDSPVIEINELIKMDEVGPDSPVLCTVDPIPLVEESVPIPVPEVIVQESTKVVEPEIVAESISNIPLPQETSIMEEEDDDDVITVVQIVDDDGEECIDIDFDIDPKQTENTSQSQKKTLIDFQEHFDRLKIKTSPVVSLLDRSDINNGSNLESCSTPDLNKESCETLLRPDPSLTPSSTISDDSNSSRILTEHNDSAESSPTAVRRSSRIKTISTLKQKTKGYGLVKTPLKKVLLTQAKMKLEDMGSDSLDKLPDMPVNVSNSPTFPVPLEMPVKVKSRWRRSSELEMGSNSPTVSPLASPGLPRMPSLLEVKEEVQTENVTTKEDCERIINDRLKQYEHVDENVYMCDRMISKDAKKMICDCFLTKEEIERGELGCGEDCLNRLLMIECNSRCPVGDRCTNRRIQKLQNTPLSVFYADKKGCGVSAPADIPSGEFLMEYVGEVLDYELFYKRALAYSEDNNLHHYFMSLKGDTVIDATMKGNISRFINHSCDPNAETQKWTVNGELRIGFFSKRDIRIGEEITFDYQFQRFGKVAQRCYCGADNCRGWIGAEPDSDDEEDEEEDDVSTTKSTSTDISQEQTVGGEGIKPARKRKPKRDRKYVPPAPELVQDADIEEDIEALSRTGIKNQSHTLSLSRSMVRAKGRRAQTSLLRLLRDADLPCRRLFLDYRGLRLLAPWCADAGLIFRWEMLQTVDRLPIPNKTIIQESRFFNIVERWLSSAAEQDTSENTGLSSDNKSEQDPAEKLKDSAALAEKVKELSKQLLERWASLKEIFKIPKKERIQQMKEHERQANVERRAADSSGSRDRDRRDERDRDRNRERERERERDRDRERERERERHKDREREKEMERERDRDRDRRKKRNSPEGRRSIRLGDRVLASVPPLTKEERRRAFAEAAAAAEVCRQNEPPQHNWPPMWPQDVPQMMPPNMMGGPPTMPPMGNMPSIPSMMNAPPGMLLGSSMINMLPDQSQDWTPGGPPPRFCPPFGGPQQFCMPPNFIRMGYPMGGYMGMPGFAQIPPPMGAMPPQQSDLTMQQNMQIPAVKVEPSLQTVPDPADVVLPSLWRSAVDTRGRTYYYHVKHRQPRWVPPTPPPPKQEESSDDEEVEQAPLPRRQPRMVEGVDGVIEVIKENKHNGLIPDHALVNVKPRKRRPGLVSERPISPRTEEDKLAGRLEVKRYKETKEKLRKKREKFLKKMKLYQKQMSKRGKKKHDLSAHEIKMLGLAAEMDSDSDTSSDSSPEITSVQEPVVPEVSPDEARRIKDHFRCNMARVMVQHLNPFRHSSAVIGKITSTSDFKHLARKLTHFVMVKELKHCTSIKELVCNESVRNKAKEFVKKYMSKYGPVYKRPPEEAD